MKKIVMIFCLMSIGYTAFAQESGKKGSLEVDYVMELKLDIEQVLNNIPAAYRSQVAEPLKQEIKNGIFVDYKLKTDGNKSIYQLIPKIDNNQSMSGMIVSQFTSQDKEPLYKIIEEQLFVKSYDVGKKYIIKDSLPNYKWKITKEKSTIAGFDVLKAEGLMNDTIPITAWYSPKLTYKDGPDRLWGLPGLVLKTELEANGAEVIIVARSVQVKEEELVVTFPKGKTITNKEFEEEMKIFQEKMKEMYGGGVDSTD